ncbi:MAG: peptidoglycan DD-metalloendopeptidase family protein [Candidatus Omnitrophica bacterium]|nr:peptidoglycan DD-metalloendopeptidase family protein [Candidatus Omnitrophota bacterium]
MVDPFVDPLDTSPVNQPAPVMRQRHDAANQQPDESFQEILSKTIDQEATPIMTPDALRIAPLDIQPNKSSSASGDANESIVPLLEEEISAPTPSALPETPPEASTNANPAPPDNMASVLNLQPQNSTPAKEVPVVQDAAITQPSAPSAEFAPSPENTTYVIQSGDTLSNIILNAMRGAGLDYNTGDVYRMVNIVAHQNHIADPDRIYAGRKIDLSAIYSQLTNAGEQPEENPVQMTWAGDIQAPLNGIITSEFGRRIHPISHQPHFHKGVDIGAPIGTPIYPIKPGVVEFSGEKSGYGQVVEIKHDDGTYSLYAHLSDRQVEAGDSIRAADRLGLSGDSGRTTGPHLHLEIHQNGAAVDPLSQIARERFALPLHYARDDSSSGQT